MEIIQTLNDKIEQNKAEMISSLSDIISIPSVAVTGTDEMPFGESVHKAYMMMLDMAEKEGFETFNADNYGGHIDFRGSEDGIVGIVGHLDVVPAGEDWEFDPYGGEVKDGKICGRGTMDDKGPVIASFFAMKALKECGYKPKKTIRLILGLDEETNWRGMDYYLSKVDSLPDFGFTPDGDFPAIHGEKGIMVFDIVKKLSASAGKGMELRSLKGGNAANSVADTARAVILNNAGTGYDNIKALIDEFRQETSCVINSRGIGKSLEITAIGKPAHGSKPEMGLNAISCIMQLLGRINFASEDVNEFIRFYNSRIGYDLHGENLGCGFCDEPSGKLVLNVGMADIDRKTASITINVRYPVTLNDEAVYDGIGKVAAEYDLGIVKGKHQQPIYVPEDDPLIETLMEIYRKQTGDTASRPLVIGGGTYARAMENVVAFGARFPSQPELEHQRNEYLSEEIFVKLAKIYGEAMYRLAEM